MYIILLEAGVIKACEQHTGIKLTLLRKQGLAYTGCTVIYCVLTAPLKPYYNQSSGATHRR